MIRHEDVYKIGYLGKPHGVHGEMQFIFSDDVFDTTDADYLLIELDGILVPFFIEEYRFRSEQMALIKFEDINTEEEARRLTGSVVLFPREIAEEKSESLSLSQIVNYTLIDNKTGKTIGKITGIDDSTVNTLFEVITLGGQELLIPANNNLFESIDTSKKIIKMVIPEGLLDL